MTDAERDHQPVRAVRNIADPYLDLLAALGDAQRRGMVHRLSVGFYEGWSPTRAEVARLVDVELGRITEDEYLLSGHSEQHAQQYLPSTGGSPLTAGGRQILLGMLLRVSGQEVFVLGDTAQFHIDQARHLCPCRGPSLVEADGKAMHH